MTDTPKTQIDRIKQNVTDVYTTLGEHLVPLPVLQDSEHMAETINAADFNILGLDVFTTVDVDLDLTEYDLIEIAERRSQLEPAPKPITITRNGVYTYELPYTGLSPVTVNYDTHNQNITVTDNGTYTYESEYDGLGTVVVNTPFPGYLNDIKAVLTNLGLTPPANYADLANFIAETYSDIHTQLRNISGE